MRVDTKPLLFLLGAALCPLGALADDVCKMKKVDSVFGNRDTNGPKGRSIANYPEYQYGGQDQNHAHSKEVCEEHRKSADKNKHLYTLTLIVDENNDKSTKDVTYGFHFLVFGTDCMLQGIYEPKEGSDDCGDWIIEDNEVFAENSQVKGTWLQMVIHDFRHKRDGASLRGYFSFTYGAYHSQTVESTGFTGKEYKSCDNIDNQKDGDVDINIAACKHRFRWDGMEKDDSNPA